MRILVTGGSGFIGTHLVDHLLASGDEVLNFDTHAPFRREHEASWRQGDVLDVAGLADTVASWRPRSVVHLAARTDTDDTDEPDVDAYRVNTDGTAHLLAALRATPGVERLVVTSTQFVCRPGHTPRHGEDFAPHTAYGKSKAICESLTREAGLDCTWTIIRPTNIWGPWHRRYPYEFWAVLQRGLYVHPGRRPVVRAYGYVGNVVDQIGGILRAPVETVAGRVFYVGDQPVELLDWVDGFARGLTGRPARVVPRWVVRLAALGGDAARLVGLPAPIFSSRYRSMIQDYPVAMESTFAALGPPRISLEEGIEETVRWLRTTELPPASGAGGDG